MKIDLFTAAERPKRILAFFSAHFYGRAAAEEVLVGALPLNARVSARGARQAAAAANAAMDVLEQGGELD